MRLFYFVSSFFIFFSSCVSDKFYIEPEQINNTLLIGQIEYYGTNFQGIMSIANGRNVRLLRLTISEEPTGKTISVDAMGDNGYFYFPNLPSGIYKLSQLFVRIQKTEGIFETTIRMNYQISVTEGTVNNLGNLRCTEDASPSRVVNITDNKYKSLGKTIIDFEQDSFEEVKDWFARHFKNSEWIALNWKNIDITNSVKSINDYTREIETKPSADAYIGRGIQKHNQGDYDGAIEDFSKAIDMDPKNAVAHNNRGLVQYHQGSFQKSLNDFNKAIQLNSKSADYLNNRGIVKLKNGAIDDAAKDFLNALKIDPNFTSAYNNLGLTEIDKKNYQNAISNFNIALNLNPKYAEAYNNRGVAQYNSGNFEEALDDWNKAIGQNPSYEDAYFNRALLQKKKSLFSEAIKDLDKLIELSPKKSKYYFERGNIKKKLRQMVEAKKDLDKAKELGKEDEI